MIIIFFIKDAFTELIISQMLLSIQLPVAIILIVYLTSSKREMGKYVNSIFDRIVLLLIGGVVTFLNVILFISFFKKFNKCFKLSHKGTNIQGYLMIF